MVTAAPSRLVGPGPRPLGPLPLAGLGSALLLVLVLWAVVTEVEVVVTVPAEARPGGEVAELRAPVARRVLRVAVREGETVERGQLLLTLEPASANARRRLLAVTLQRRRSEREVLTRVSALLESGAPLDRVSDRVVRWRVVEARSGQARRRAELRALLTEQSAARRRAAASARLLEMREERYQAARRAFERRALSRSELLRAQQDRLAQRAAQQADAASVEVIQGRIDAHRLAQREALASLRAGQRATLATLDLQLAEVEAELAELADLRRLGRLRAPLAGVVERLRVHAGDFVQQGERLAVIVPTDVAVFFETRIAPEQAAFLHDGQRCRIKLDALPFARYGALPCTLTRLSRDALPGEGGGERHYRARARPSAQWLQVEGRPFRLQPGATGWVDIIAGRRRVSSFVTEPLRRFASESLREP